jgi:peptidoglycan/xylan/chitin deacetylase (PgdA/CDA1 family)
LKIPSKYSLANLTGIPRLVNWLNRNRLLVLTYHGIYDGPKQPGAMPDTFIHVRDMEAQLKAIKRRYHIVKPDKLLDSLDSGVSLPPDSALITFDDGYESFYRLAEPVLITMGIRAVVFVPTRYIERHEPFWFDLIWVFVRYANRDGLSWFGNLLNLEDGTGESNRNLRGFLNKVKTMVPEERDPIISELSERLLSLSADSLMSFSLFYPMNDEQIRTSAERGFFFGGHTHSHTIMSYLPYDKAKEEIITNKEKLESITGKFGRFFAYPNGSKEDFDAKDKEILRKAGFSLAFTLIQKRSLFHENVMEISRFNVAPEDTVESLLLRCTGLQTAMPITRMRNMIKL